MKHLVDELKAKADANIAAMRDAALRARDTHARAELMRHMLMTADKVKDRPTADAVRFIVDHWLEAWGLARASWPHVAEMEAFAAAFHAYAMTPTDAHDDAVRATCVRLELGVRRRPACRSPTRWRGARSARTAGGRTCAPAAGQGSS